MDRGIMERHAREALVSLVAMIRCGLEIEDIRNTAMTEAEALGRLKETDCAMVNGWLLVSVERKDSRFECMFTKNLPAGTGQTFPCVTPATLLDAAFDTRAVIAKKLARAERSLRAGGGENPNIVRHGKAVKIPTDLAATLKAQGDAFAKLKSKMRKKFAGDR